MTLTYAHIEDLYHRYRAELTRRLFAMVSSRDAAADLLQDTAVLYHLTKTFPTADSRSQRSPHRPLLTYLLNFFLCRPSGEV